MASQAKLAGAVVGTFAAIVIIAVFTAWYNGAVSPVAHVPTPVMPKPNAFDDFQAASTLFGDRDLVENALNPAVAEGFGEPVASHAQQLAAATRDMVVVQRLRIGLTRPYQAPPVRKMDDYAPSVFRDRSLAELLRFEGRFAAKRGDWTEAANDDIEAIELGFKIMHGSSLIDGLVGMACSAIGSRDCWSAISHLDSVTARADCSRLQAALASRPSESDILQQEQWHMQAAIADPGETGAVYNSGLEPVGWSGFLRTQLLQTLYPRRTIYANFTRYMGHRIELARLPYPLAADVQTVTPDDPFDLSYIPALGMLGYKDVYNRTSTTLLVTALALRAYRLDRGAYPGRLADMVPAHLAAVPIDPLTNNLPLRYRKKGVSYVLYSIGPDGIDNGGKPFVNTNPAIKYWTPDTKGDIVAGVNTE